MNCAWAGKVGWWDSPGQRLVCEIAREEVAREDENVNQQLPETPILPHVIDDLQSVYGVAQWTCVLLSVTVITGYSDAFDACIEWAPRVNSEPLRFSRSS